MQFGYSAADFNRLETDIRNGLEDNVDSVIENEYGIRYIMRITLASPSGLPLSVRCVWQQDEGTDYPRFITMIPD